MGEIKIKNKVLKCHHCGSEKFEAISTKMNEKWNSFLDVEFMSRNCTTYVCKYCGLTHEFVS